MQETILRSVPPAPRSIARSFFFIFILFLQHDLSAIQLSFILSFSTANVFPNNCIYSLEPRSKVF